MTRPPQGLSAQIFATEHGPDLHDHRRQNDAHISQLGVGTLTDLYFPVVWVTGKSNAIQCLPGLLDGWLLWLLPHTAPGRSRDVSSSTDINSIRYGFTLRIPFNL